MKVTFLILLFISVIFSSCIKNNPDPAWIEVNEWMLVANPTLDGFEGELTHNFSEAAVYIDDQSIGIFEVPFRIPILKTGNVNIKIYPVIKNNGISATKKIYPFVEVFEVNATLTKNQTLLLNPITKYKSASDFWIEDFEDSFIAFETDPTSTETMNYGNEPSILMWGTAYGVVNLDEIDSTWIAYTNENLYLPKGKEVYLELNYYNTNSVTSGIIAGGPNGISPNPTIRMNSQSPSTVTWKKIYIDLKETISYSSSAEYFKLSFQGYLDDSNTQGQIILDNIKVVHF